jgi:histidine ammonia-lyase
MQRLALDGRSLDWAVIESAYARAIDLEFAPEAEERVRRARGVVESILASGSPVYGINTGFGKLSDKRIGTSDLLELQRRLVLSHATGLGATLPEPETRLMVLFRINTLLRGNSGCTPGLLRALADLLAREVYPVIPEQGSVGASGDLAPLAHMALALIGEGEARRDGRTGPAREILSAAGLEPYTLREKEGISLINGTQFSLSILAASTLRMSRLVRLADLIGAMTVDALMGSARPFDARIQAVRPFSGQAEAAENLRGLIGQSEILRAHQGCGKVQDNYSVRCMPQVHGAAREVLGWVRGIVLTEVNSSVDNPLVFEDGAVLSGGNFHGQMVALAADALSNAAATLGNISERRIDALTNPDFSGLPAFLARDGGLDSGFMNAQVAAAALTAENRTLSMPASVMSIPTSAGKEDHVPMAPIAARHLRKIIDNVEYILSIEALLAAQGLDLRAPLKSSPRLEAARQLIRSKIPTLERDRYLKPDIEAMRGLLPELLASSKGLV